MILGHNFILQNTDREEGELSESEEELDENIRPDKLNVSWDGLTNLTFE